MWGSQKKNLGPKVNVKYFMVDPRPKPPCNRVSSLFRSVDLADMVPFWAEIHVFQWSRQEEISTIDSF